MKAIKIILQNSSYYPPKLHTLKQPPEFLLALGNRKLLNTFGVGIVGARACTEESILLTKQLVPELSRRGITIISGMADGIDQIAHQECIHAKGKTIAIIGCGFEIAKKEKIFSEILENDGLIISEYFPDIPALRYHFPRRNQILVALSKAIVAVETHVKSGTMITAKEALQQQIPLFTFPGDIYNKKFYGNNLLLTKGAFCINSYSDIIKKLKTIYPNEKFIPHLCKTSSLKIPNEFQDIYSILDEYPQHINNIAKKINLPLHELQSKLTLMELEDFICQVQNNYYLRN